jgi:hypothetical protein
LSGDAEKGQGEPVRVLAIGQTSGKGFNAQRTKDDEEVEFCSPRVGDVEIRRMLMDSLTARRPR